MKKERKNKPVKRKDTNKLEKKNKTSTRKNGNFIRISSQAIFLKI